MKQFIIVALVCACLPLRALSAKVRVNGDNNQKVEIDYDSTSDYIKYVRWITVESRYWSDNAMDNPQTAADCFAIKLYLEDQVRVEVFRAMQQSSENFDFGVTYECYANITLRLKAIYKLSSMCTGGWYQYPDTADPAEFVTTACGNWMNCQNPRNFYKTKNEAVSLYEAIQELCDEPNVTVGECYGAITACIWWGSAEASGAGGFDADNPSFLGLDMALFRRAADWGANQPGFYTYDADDTATYIPGDWLAMTNSNYHDVVRKYREVQNPPLDPNVFNNPPLDPSKVYLAQAENCLCLDVFGGTPSFGGLGSVGFLFGVDEETLRTSLMAEYNDKLAPVLNRGLVLGGVDLNDITDIMARDVIWFNNDKERARATKTHVFKRIRNRGVVSGT